MAVGVYVGEGTGVCVDVAVGRGVSLGSGVAVCVGAAVSVGGTGLELDRGVFVGSSVTGSAGVPAQLVSNQVNPQIVIRI